MKTYPREASNLGRFGGGELLAELVAATAAAVLALELFNTLDLELVDGVGVPDLELLALKY